MNQKLNDLSHYRTNATSRYMLDQMDVKMDSVLEGPQGTTARNIRVETVPWTLESKFNPGMIDWFSMDAAGLYGSDVTELRIILYEQYEAIEDIQPIVKIRYLSSNECVKPHQQSKVYPIGRIYKITNDIDELVYVGGTTGSIEKRFIKHKSDARNGSRCSLHCHMREYGFEHFKIETIDTVTRTTLDALHALETMHIVWQKTMFNGLNMTYPCLTCNHDCNVTTCKLCNIDLVCEHCMYISSCNDCYKTERALLICSHKKMKTSCRSCNICKYCGTFNTQHHINSDNHKQNEIRIYEQELRLSMVKQQKYKTNARIRFIGFTITQHTLLMKSREKRLGFITLHKPNKPRSITPSAEPLVLRDAWEVMQEILNQAEK